MFVMAICAGAIATHSLVPPTPGPLGMADTLGLDLGTAIVFGLLLGILPVTAALMVAPRFAKRVAAEPPADPADLDPGLDLDRADGGASPPGPLRLPVSHRAEAPSARPAPSS